MSIRVLVVDDSATMRAMLRQVLNSDPEIEVVGEAADPYEAREEIKRLSPDVLTLDVEMPRMNGLEFLQKLMAARPMPVVMVSSLTQIGADNTMAALELGAVDFVAKPTGRDALKALTVLPNKVKLAHGARLSKKTVPAKREQSANQPFKPGRVAVAIGASTGGVDALMNVIKHFPKNCPPTLIVQHMPAKFTTSFASRLNGITEAEVCEAETGFALKPGHIYLAPGGNRHLELDIDTGLKCRLTEGENYSGHTPSVDILFHSMAKLGKRALGVILTGMGGDGAEGLKYMRDAGGRTIGQNESSCIVYGMPKVAHEMGGVERQLPLNLIGPAILEACNAEHRVHS